MPETLTAPPPAQVASPRPSTNLAPKAPPTAREMTSGELPKSSSAPPPTENRISARERFNQRLAAKAKDGNGQPANPPPTASTPPKPAEKPAAQAAPDNTPKRDTGEVAGEASAPAIQPGDQLADGQPGQPVKKESPWKLLDTYKKKTLTLEKELADLRTSGAPVEEVRVMKQRLETAEKRAAELDEEIRFHDVTKNSKYQQEILAPLENAWKNAMSELGELTVADPVTGQDRYVTTSDLLELVNLPLGKAYELAKKTYGPDFAAEAMRHRAKIKELGDQQHAAIQKAKEEATVRDQKRAEETQRQQAQFQAQRAAIDKEVGEKFREFSESVKEDPKLGRHFKPIDGDTEGNAKLEKGYKFVEEAFALNPKDPRLTPEQRALVVKKHAALWNRAAAFGRLTHQLSQAETKLAAMQKELNQYKGTEPADDPNAGGEVKATPMRGFARMSARLRSVASK